MALERLWAAWRSEYVGEVTAANRSGEPHDCVFCALIAEGPSEQSGVVALDEHACCLLNAYPYGSGHLLILPLRHTAALGDLSATEAQGLWAMTLTAVGAVETAYGADGINLGANLGQAAGAGIPAHLHLHVLPRWQGDTNFMTSIAETRVLPESMPETWRRVSAAWGA